MAHGPDWSSDSEDSLFADDGDYMEFKHKLRQNRAFIQPKEVTEEQKRQQEKLNFVSAITSGTVEEVSSFLSSGIDIQADLKDGWTAILLAASSGRPEIVNILIKAGANVNQDHDGLTPLMVASNSPSYTVPFEKSLKVVKLLVENGANVQAVNRKRMDALMHAACNGNLLVVEYLLPVSNKDAVDNQMWNALTWAVSNNQPETVKFLYEKGFAVDLIDVRGNTPLDIAKENGLDEIVNIFPKGQDNLVEEILLQQTRLTFEQNFADLKKNEIPVFFEDVCDFLLSVKCSQLIPLFHDNNVSLEQLLSMDDDDLKAVGVRFPYQRNRVLSGLHRFHKQPFLPKSLHVCIKNDTYSNVDVATQLMSAIKQIIAMEAGLKYLFKHLKGEKLTRQEQLMVYNNIEDIKLKIQRLKTVLNKLNKRFERWDALASPADAITKDSVKVLKDNQCLISWKKLGIGCSVGLFCYLVIFKLKSSSVK